MRKVRCSPSSKAANDDELTAVEVPLHLNNSKSGRPSAAHKFEMEEDQSCPRKGPSPQYRRDTRVRPPSNATQLHLKKTSNDFARRRFAKLDPEGAKDEEEKHDWWHRYKAVRRISLSFGSSFGVEHKKLPSPCPKCGPVIEVSNFDNEDHFVMSQLRPSKSAYSLSKRDFSTLKSGKDAFGVCSLKSTFPLKKMRKCSFHVEKKINFKLHRRKSHSVVNNTVISNRILKLPFEQVKKSKTFTEKAVQEMKVFSIHGSFPALREELTRRGWVEKVLHSYPYCNPHPHNCPCNPNGAAAAAVISPRSPKVADSRRTSFGTTTSFTSAMKTRKNQLSLVHSMVENDNNNVPSSLEKNLSDNHVFLSGDQLVLLATPAENEENVALSSTSLEEKKEYVIGEKETTAVPHLEVLGEEEEEHRRGHGPVTTKTPNLATCKSHEFKGHPSTLSCIGEESRLLYSERIRGTVCKCGEAGPGSAKAAANGKINTTFLAPSEIRNGLERAINEDNISLFQYTVPLYDEMKQKTTILKANKLKANSKRNENSVSEHREMNESLESTENPFPQGGGEDAVDGRVSSEEAACKDSNGSSESKPYNPYPDLDYRLTHLDKPVVARVLRNVEPNFIWSWNKESISFKHIGKDQLVNRYPNTPFTTKFGLCETLQQLHWFSEMPCVDSFVPRAYCIGLEEERRAFVADYRTTACIAIVKWMVTHATPKNPHSATHPVGEISMRRIRQALHHVEKVVASRCHGDLDTAPASPIKENEWDLIFSAHHKLILQGRKVKALPHHSEALLRDCKVTLDRVKPHWTQIDLDGFRNVWIVKPGAQSRGRGIFLLSHLPEILGLVQSPLIYQTKYVVQKYIERPLLIYNTKFDVRQWFIVTDWNPLTLWMYNESYLRFCSREFDLGDPSEAVHLSNNAVQCKYLNGSRDERLPEENMWHCDRFKQYLESVGQKGAYEQLIYPGMKEALIATMLVSQTQIDPFKQGFEFFGADFMLTHDLRPWLIEINCSPCMAATTSVTRQMCHESLSDTIKVVVDHRRNSNADTGKFELIYCERDKSSPPLPYNGVSLQVTGRRVGKFGPKQGSLHQKHTIPPNVRANSAFTVCPNGTAPPS